MRFRAPFIEPVEIWDAMIGGRTVFEWQQHPARLPAVLGALVQQLRLGQATFEQARPSPADFPAVGHVHILGGRALCVPLPPLLPGVDLPVTVAADPLFAAAHAGAALRPGALVADVGQTAVKVVYRGARHRCPRDFSLLPMASDLTPETRREARPAVVDFVAGAIRLAIAAERPSAAVLALPCELDEHLTASGCSYPYPKPDATLVRDILGAAGLSAAAALVLNDAELAACAAALDERVPRDRATLVVTLGFGVGGALLRERA